MSKVELIRIMKEIKDLSSPEWYDAVDLVIEMLSEMPEVPD